MYIKKISSIRQNFVSLHKFIFSDYKIFRLVNLQQ